VPQLPGLEQVTTQLTPALLGSFVTAAFRVIEPLIGIAATGGGSKAMETLDEAGGGGFCTLNVLPPPQPASVAMIAVDRRKQAHR
jgi:hypothetical protein